MKTTGLKRRLEILESIAGSKEYTPPAMNIVFLNDKGETVGTLQMPKQESKGKA